MPHQQSHPCCVRTRSPRHRFDSLTSVSLRAPSPACANASVSSSRSCIGLSIAFPPGHFLRCRTSFFGTLPPLGLSPVLIVLGDWLTLTLFRRISRDSMIAGRPFLYQSKEGTVYHVAQNGVEAIRSSWSAIHMWSSSLSTATRGIANPNTSSSFPQCRLLWHHPRKARIKWMGNYTIVTKLATNLLYGRLSTLTRLERLSLEFESPLPSSCPVRGSRRLSPPTRSVLSVPRNFRLIGVSEYVEDLVAQIDAPLLNDLSRTFLHCLILETP
jgi:hypothetical protein